MALSKCRCSVPIRVFAPNDESARHLQRVESQVDVLLADHTL